MYSPLVFAAGVILLLVGVGVLWRFVDGTCQFVARFARFDDLVDDSEVERMAQAADGCLMGGGVWLALSRSR